MKVISPLMHVVSRIISPFYPPLLLKEPALCPPRSAQVFECMCEHACRQKKSDDY